MTPLRGLLLALSGTLALIADASAQQRGIALDQLKSGREFLGAELRAMQDDDFSNPGLLWVERGQVLWRAQPASVKNVGAQPASVNGGAQPAGGAKSQSCAGCHGELSGATSSMRGVAARYPAIDRASGRLFNLEDRIRDCRSQRQGQPAPAFESEELLSLTAALSHASRGMPMQVRIDGAAKPAFEAGQKLFYQRIGQLNLSCAHCHEASWGRTLYAERISQGHPNAHPIYRLDWQNLGSLERRLRACFFGIRAALPAFGSSELRELSLFLAWRAQGVEIEAPGVRR
jgi:sulfur-oxidizing protein SoxA